MRNFKIKLAVGCSAMVLALGASQAFADDTVLGTGASATGGNSTAIGSNANASGGGYGVALGADTVASGDHAIAQGHSTQATGNDSIAIGAHDTASGQSSLVIGSRSSVSGDFSTVVGAGSSASGINSVALGRGSVADEDNVVSVGAGTNTRRITNLAAGASLSDAATVGQAQQISADALVGANAYADGVANQAGNQALALSRTYADTKAAATLTAANAYTDFKVDGFVAQYDNRLNKVSDRLDGVGAMSSAMSMMAGNSAGAAAGLTNRLSMAVGGYRGQGAIAAGYTHNTRAISVNLGVSATGRDVMSGGSVGFAW